MGRGADLAPGEGFPSSGNLGCALKTWPPENQVSEIGSDNLLPEEALVVDLKRVSKTPSGRHPDTAGGVAAPEPGAHANGPSHTVAS